MKKSKTKPTYHSTRGILLLYLILSLSSCNTTKHLSEGEYLYTGSEINLVSKSGIPEKKELTSSLQEALYPEPNRKFLGLLRLRLWFYYLAGETDKNKGFKHWLKYKMGEPPVLLEKVNQENVSRLIRNKTFNRGHFTSRVNHKTQLKNKKASVTYSAELSQPYRIARVEFPESATRMLHTINKSRDETLLEEGKLYSIDLLEHERQRIKNNLLKKGFYYFSSSALYFQVDSTEGNKKVNLYLKTKDKLPEKASVAFRIKDVYVYSNFSLEDTLSSSCPDTLLVDGMHYISRIDRFRPESITDVIFLTKNDLYNREDHNKTISRLIGMNAFKFVNIRFEEALVTDSIGWLNMHVYLTPEKLNSLRAEVKGVTKSNNFVGPGLELSFINRNIFRGAEMLTIAGHGNWETQIGGNRQNLNSYELGLNTRLQYPRLETPFHVNPNKLKYVPSTFIDLGYNFQHRVKYYTAHTFNTGFGYSWKNAVTSRSDLTVIGIEYYELGNTTQLFENKLDSNAYLANTFRDQFMIGPRYSYTYNDQVKTDLKNNFYFQGRVDMSGLIVNSILEGIDAFQQGNENTNKLFGSLYAQYFKIDGDVRYYQSLKQNNKLVFRFFAGAGFPFGQSETLPFVKQYYGGGTNGIRAFRAREIGPGSFSPPVDAGEFFEQTGDVKLEANTELRFAIQGSLKGALFVDAGNVWLMNQSDDRPGGVFSFDKFYRQIAVGSGFGLRFDLSFLILRLDLAFPLRKPWLPEGDRWVADEIFGYKGWGRQNLVWNIAIGYPF